MSTSVVINNSEKKVIRSRTSNFSGFDGTSVALLAMGSQVASMIVVAAPLDVFAGFETGVAFGVSVSAGVGLLAMALRFFSLQETAEDFSRVTTGSSKKLAPIWGSFLRSLSPYSKSKKERYTVKTTMDNSDLVRKDSSYHGLALKYDVETRAIYGPINCYIEQTFTPTPEAIWDEAFSSTQEVYEFSTVKG